MTDIQAIIFDFGGVLVRTEDWSGRRRWAQKAGLSDDAFYDLVFNCDAAIKATVGEIPEEAVWETVGKALRLSPPELAQCRTEFWAGDYLDKNLVSLIQRLRPRYKTGILSNAWSSARDNFARLFGLDRVVDVIVISAEEKIAKPDPRIYRLAAERLGVEPAQAVFIDDVAENIDGARAVGMHGILFTPGMDLEHELRSLGVQM